MTYFYCRGVWNVPFVTSAILMSGEWIRGLSELPKYGHVEIDSDMAFSLWMRQNVN